MRNRDDALEGLTSYFHWIPSTFWNSLLPSAHRADTCAHRQEGGAGSAALSLRLSLGPSMSAYQWGPSAAWGGRPGSIGQETVTCVMSIVITDHYVYIIQYSFRWWGLIFLKLNLTLSKPRGFVLNYKKGQNQEIMIFLFTQSFLTILNYKRQFIWLNFVSKLCNKTSWHFVKNNNFASLHQVPIKVLENINISQHNREVK